MMEDCCPPASEVIDDLGVVVFRVEKGQSDHAIREFPQENPRQWPGSRKIVANE
jgi:hypothetical protein